jgi:hypothetical protein
MNYSPAQSGKTACIFPLFLPPFYFFIDSCVFGYASLYLSVKNEIRFPAFLRGQ